MDVHEVLPKRKKKFIKKKRKNKLVLVFDENARREFLTGFQKRKTQRKQKAKEEFEKQLKLEKKRIRAQAKNEYKRLLLAQKPIPELEDLLSEELDMGTHSVQVTELSTADLAKKNNWIGANEVQYEEKKPIVSKRKESTEKVFEIEGMETQKRGKTNLKKGVTMKNAKDVKKFIKNQATLNVKKSKIFKKKAVLEKIKNIKSQRRQEKLRRKRQRAAGKKNTNQEI